MTKKCIRCSSSYPLENFVWDRKDRNGAVYAQVETKNCSFCRADLLRYRYKWIKTNPRASMASYDDWYKKNKVVAGERSRNRHLKRTYGLSPEDYARMLKDQNGLCKICSMKNENGHRLAVDHCHKTGKVRGLLCAPCNTMIGLAKEDKARLLSAIDYLEGLHTFGSLIKC